MVKYWPCQWEARGTVKDMRNNEEIKEKIAASDHVARGDENARKGNLAGAIANYSQALATYKWCQNAYDKLGDLLENHSKDKIVDATSLPEEKYLNLIEQCKDKTTLIGKYFWHNR